MFLLDKKGKTSKDSGWRLSKDGRIYKKGVKKYPNKDLYEGEFIDGLRHGRGTLKMSNGNKYTGEFENNQFHGFGEMIWAPFDINGREITNRRYEGNFKMGKRHGKGMFILGTGETYSGQFEDNLYHGQGTWRNAVGDLHSGEFCRGLPHGKVEIKYANGDTFSGIMVLGKFSGEGKYTYTKGQGFYEGSWVKGLPHGRGIRMFSNGNKYVGAFQHGVVDGEGLMMFANGDQYVGDWRRGLFEGKGTIAYRHGDRYEGAFLAGHRFGEGKYYWVDGGTYEGEYYTTQTRVREDGEQGPPFPAPDGLRNGFGKRVWSNGSRYEGEWRADKMQGQGILTRSDGGEYRGEFSIGVRHGIGTEQIGNVLGREFVCPLSGRHKGDEYCIYSGQWFFDQFQGLGTLTCCDGRSYSGQWKGGKRHGKGLMKFLRVGEAGNPRRMWIGGVDSLYRPVEYEGQWQEGERHGHGVLRYLNGDELEGNLVYGFLEGLVLHRFGGSLEKVRYAFYSKGRRLQWRDEELSRAPNLLRTLRINLEVNSRQRNQTSQRKDGTNDRLEEEAKYEYGNIGDVYETAS